MNNRYFEYNVKPNNEEKEKKLLLVLKILKFIFTLISVVIFYFAFMFSNYFWFIFVIVLTITIVLWYFQLKIYNYFDFIFVDGEISVIKIINNQKRKSLASFNVKLISKIGIIGKGSYLTYFKDKNIKKIQATNKVLASDLYFLVDNGEKLLITLPFNEKFLAGILRYNLQNKLEKELINLIDGKKL